VVFFPCGCLSSPCILEEEVLSTGDSLGVVLVAGFSG
jgi:hypothetical protein